MRGGQHFRYGLRVSFPGLGAIAEIATASGGEAVELRFAIVFGKSPIGDDELLAFKSPQSGIQRAFFEEKGVVALTADEAGNAVSVLRSPDECFENENVECAAKELEFG